MNIRKAQSSNGYEYNTESQVITEILKELIRKVEDKTML